MPKAKKSKHQMGAYEEPVIPEGIPDDCPFFSGVIFYHHLLDGTRYKWACGQIFLSSEHAQPIRRLVLDAARRLGHRVPSISAFDRAELLFRDQTLVEMRADGKCVVGMNNGGGIEIGYWSTPETPKFTRKGRHIVLTNTADKGNAYIVVVNMISGVIVSWDLSTQYNSGELAAADEVGRYITISMSAGVDEEGDDNSITGGFSAKAVAEERQRRKAKTIFTNLSPKQSLGPDELLVVNASDKQRLWIYLVNAAEFAYESRTSGLASYPLEKPRDRLLPRRRRGQRRRKRPKGRPQRTNKEYEEIRASREQAIRDAVMSLCTEAGRRGEDVFAAEDILTPAEVAKVLGTHPSTVYRWLNRYGLDFDQIINACLREVVFAGKYKAREFSA